MNIELAYNLLEILQTMQKAVHQMREYFCAGEITKFNSLSMDIWDGLFTVQRIVQKEVPAVGHIRLVDACTCGMVSLKDIKMLVITKPEKVEWKLEYELAPIIETAAVQFYYWGIVEEHPEKEKAFREFLANTETFEILKVSEENWGYQFDLVISVTGYNHLDYTKRCVQSILENLPVKIKSEIILLNHGSTDETKEYFENMEEIKVVNVAVNGVMPCVTQKAVSRGRYNLHVSNDIILGKSVIENLYRGMIEHEDYGYVVPTTPAVSNLQSIWLNYNSYEEFMRATAENNVYDEKRHEQRVRLCNPLHIMPVGLCSRLLFDTYIDKYCNRLNMSFPDDKYSLWMRRKGYKCILAKDAYCHHFGSVTLSHDLGTLKEQQKFYADSRAAFLKKYGVDPWGPGFCYSHRLFEKWHFPIVDNAFVLGINCGLGSNSLKVKEILRENGAKGVVLYNVVQDGRYFQDTKGVSDEAFLISGLNEIGSKTGRNQYHYIVAEELILEGTGNSVRAVLEAGLIFDEIAYKNSEGEWEIFKTDKRNELI